MAAGTEALSISFFAPLKAAVAIPADAAAASPVSKLQATSAWCFLGRPARKHRYIRR